MDEMLRLPEVMAITGLSRSSIYLRMSRGTFPKSVKMGGRAVGWVKEEIVQLVESWKAARKDKK